MFARLLTRTGRSSYPLKARPLTLSQPFPLQIRDKSSSMGPNEAFKGSNLSDVSHVTALVTGGGSGIGLMITQALVANGAKVYITGRREEALEKVQELYNTGPGSIQILPGDITKKDEITRLVEEMTSKAPDGIQLLVNNAGVARDDNTRFGKNEPPDFKDPKAISEHFMKSQPEQWAETFMTNVTAGFFMSMAFLPLLAKGQENCKLEGYTSSIVNVSSISGALKSMSGGQPSYSASKAAFTQVSRNIASTIQSTKIRCNIIAPGIFPSEMTSPDGKSDENQKVPHQDTTAGNPVGRKGLPEDMAAAILLLAGRGGTFYNEQILYPDGAATLANPALL